MDFGKGLWITIVDSLPRFIPWGAVLRRDPRSTVVTTTPRDAEQNRRMHTYRRPERTSVDAIRQPCPAFGAQDGPRIQQHRTEESREGRPAVPSENAKITPTSAVEAAYLGTRA